MSARDALRGYSKSELERITVLAARKEHAAREALRTVRRGVLKRILLGFMAGAAAGASAVWAVLR